MLSGGQTVMATLFLNYFKHTVSLASVAVSRSAISCYLLTDI